VRYGEKFQRPAGWSVRFVLSEDTSMVDTVRWIFDTYANTDTSMSWIVAELNRRGIKTPNSKTWSIQTIENILTNRVYTGASVFGRRRYGKYHYLKNGEAARGKSTQRNGVPIVTEGIHESLIDAKTFDRIQKKMTERQQDRSRPRYNRYLLSGLLYCGHCGGKLAGKGYHRKDIPRYYACVNGQTRPGACKRYQVPQVVLENYVFEVVHKRLFQDDVIKQIKEAIHRQSKNNTTFRNDTKALQARVVALDKKIIRGTENLLLAKPDDMEDISKMLASWRKERAELQTKLEKTITTVGGSSPENRAKRAISELKNLKKHLQSADPMRSRAVLKSLIAEIRLWFEPYGKQQRLAKGFIRFKDNLELLPMGSRAR
jgi:site-specific DNA recombinase